MTMFRFTKKTICGCESRGDAHRAYLTRYELLSTKRGKLCLHIFHRSDADEFHDHPWRFWTLILWRGYQEVTHDGSRRLWPGMLLFRPATWSHRVQLIQERPAITLLWMGHREREWGFFTRGGWQHWKDYFHEKGC